MAAKSVTKKVAGAGRGRPPADGKKKKKSTAKMLMSNSSAPKMTSDGIILQNLMNKLFDELSANFDRRI